VNSCVGKLYTYEHGLKPDSNKIKAVKGFSTPTNCKAIKQFLGLAGYYQQFISEFSRIAKSLTDLKKDATFIWQNIQNEAFNQLRDVLCSQPILQFPDFTQHFIVTIDVSGYVIGGILSQDSGEKDLPIAYASRLLNAAEKKLLDYREGTPSYSI
jgi:hypothetical protein